jgi:hypothetical protein
VASEIENIAQICSIEKMAEFMAANDHSLSTAKKLISTEKSLLSKFYSKPDTDTPSVKGTENLFQELMMLLNAGCYEAAQVLFFACLKRAEIAYHDLLRSDFSGRADLYLTKCLTASLWISVANHCQLLIRKHYV